MPIVSIVIPFYNARATLKGTLVSVLNQTYSKDIFEVILVDDGSIDGSLKSIQNIVKKALGSSFSVRIVSSKKRLGPAAAKNRGIRLSTGKIVAFTDSDCVVDNAWLKHLVNAFESNKIGGVYGRVKTFGSASLFPPLYIAPVTAQNVKYTTCNIAYRKNVLLKAGLFDEAFKEPYREDTDLALRVLKAGYNIVYEPKAIVRHPVKALSLSKFIKTAFNHKYDNLLYLKHSKDASEHFGVTRPLIGPFSPLGLLALLGLISPIFGVRIFGLLWFLFLLTLSTLFYVLFFVVRGYRLVTSQRTKVTMTLRAKSAVALLIYIILLIIARCYGCLKYQKFLL